LVGYDNVLSVGIDPHGQILLGGAPCGLTAPERAGSATLAAWGGSIRLGAPGTAPLEGSVERVGTGPGRWDVLVHAGATLRAHLPLGDEPPRPGDRVAVSIDGARATVISSPARREGGAQGAKGVRPQV
jgi:hypothetical protein